MLSKLWNAGAGVCGFVRRHKKMVIAGGVVVSAAGAYYAMRKVIDEAERMAEEMQKEFEEHGKVSEERRKEAHLLRSKEECEAAVYRFLPTFRVKLYNQLDIDEAIARLRTLDPSDREERNQLWEQVKLLGFTRYLSAVYVFSLLHLLVHIQLHLIGGQSYEQARIKATMEEIPAETNDNEQSDAARDVLASTIEYLVEVGLPMLIQHTKDVVEKDSRVQEWTVHEKTEVDRDEFFQLLESLHESIIPDCENQPEDEKLSQWRSFIIYSEKKGNTSPQAMKMLNQIWGIIDSSLFQTILTESLNRCFQLLCQDLSHGIFQSGFQKPPLAKIIPRMKYEVGQLYSGKKQEVRQRYCRELSELETLRTLCHDIFLQIQLVD